MSNASRALSPGLQGQASLLVEDRHTVPALGPDWPGFGVMPPVFATAMMVAFTEETCIRTLEGLLDPGQKTVGIHIDMSHTRATPIGMTVTVDAELTAIDGRKLTFAVVARDNEDMIGKGTHQRAIIDTDAFINSVNEKAQRV